jgi:antitoxin ParD1/3/4
MSTIEKISIPLRDWTSKRSSSEKLRALWQEANGDESPTVSAEDVLDRLESKYLALAEAKGK